MADPAARWLQRQGRHMSPGDRATLLHLMSDAWYQQTKLGAAFSRGDQLRSSRFWQLAAAYLRQPLPAVLQAGTELWPEAVEQRRRLKRRRELQRLDAWRAQQGEPAAAASPAALHLPTPEPAGAAAAAAAGGKVGSSGGSGSKAQGGSQQDELQHVKRAAGPAPATAAGSLPAAPAAPEVERQPARKKQRHTKGAARAAPPAVEDPYSGAFAAFRPARAAAAPEAAAPSSPGGAEAEQQPARKKQRQAGGTARADLPAAAAEEPHDPYSGAFAAFRPTPAAAAAAVAVPGSRGRAEARAPAAGNARLPTLRQARQQARQQGSSAEAGGEAPAAAASQQAPAQERTVRVEINLCLPPSTSQQHESPPFVGVTEEKRGQGRQLPWRSKAMIGNKDCHLASCPSRASAAAAHDVARIWCKLHGKEVEGKQGGNVNFPQLLEDRQLERELQAAPNVPALQAFIAGWLAQRWPGLEAAVLAGRAAALDRYVRTTSRKRGITLTRRGWLAQIKLNNQYIYLGTWPSAKDAGVVWDVASVWRHQHASSTSASQLFNHPQLRLWEDAALVARLQGIHSREELQGFVKAWAKENLRAMVQRLQQLEAPADAAP